MGRANRRISSAGQYPNKLSTQANYEQWLATLDQRGLPVGTVVIDDKWQQAYGTFEVDQQKWPDLKGFVAAQKKGEARGNCAALTKFVLRSSSDSTIATLALAARWTFQATKHAARPH